jgi:hypothetical protein
MHNIASDSAIQQGIFMGYDRSAEDIGNIVHFEHVNLTIPDQQLATQFYVTTLGLTRDPYMNTGVDNMWINVGATQFHLPTREMAQRFRGSVALVLPNLAALLARLRHGATALAGTAFGFDEHADHVAVRCPWGNRLRCYEPDDVRFGATSLGIVEVEVDVAPGAAAPIARFYRDVLHARATLDGSVARVKVGVAQQMVFRETDTPLRQYDGHHIQVYVADFGDVHRRLIELGLVTEESSQHEYRFVDVVDPATAELATQLEHEVRSVTHPMYRRALVNRNPQQNAQDYRPDADAFHA